MNKNLIFFRYLFIFTVLSLLKTDALATDQVQVITKRFGSSVYTTDMTPIEISISNNSIVKKFRIPKAYIEKSYVWSEKLMERADGEVGMIDIRAVLPDMTPYAFSKIYDDKNKLSSVFIFLKGKRLNKNYRYASYKRISAYERIGRLTGLEAYRKDNGDELYVTQPNDESRYISIRCPPLKKGFHYTRCRVTTSYKGWSLEYVFYSVDRSNWKIYDNNVQTLLSQLEIEN